MLNAKQFVNQMKARRSATQQLHGAAGWSGYHTGLGQGSHSMGRQGDPFGGNTGTFSAPNYQDRLESATNAARKAGVSSRKINKTISKTQEIGYKEGLNARRKANPFG